MTSRLPTLFLSHGSPMTAVEPGPAGAAWVELGRTLPRPRAILVASAHWETATPMLTGSATPETIHDFGGFPHVLYTLRYPAPGAPDVAAEATALRREAGFDAGIDARRGLDHGTWVPLLHMFPQADVPVVQLSLQTERGAAHHLALGAAIAPLAKRGVVVVGSGHATHNLRDWMMHRGRPGELPYVARFSAWVADALAANDDAALARWLDVAPDARRAHPTDEHFLPLHVAYAAAGPRARSARVHASVAVRLINESSPSWFNASETGFAPSASRAKSSASRPAVSSPPTQTAGASQGTGFATTASARRW